MSITEKQLFAIKNECAKELGYEDFNSFWLRSIEDGNSLKFLDRCMQLSYQQAMKDVEAKLPDSRLEARWRFTSGHGALDRLAASIFNRGSRWAIEQIKKTIKP